MYTTLLIDADIVAYKFASKAQENFAWSEEVTSTALEPLEDAVAHAVDYLEELQDKLKADSMLICLSSPTNFRLSVLPTYKANRKDVIRPVHLAGIKEALADKYPSYVIPDLEADDVMGILSTHPKMIQGTKIIVSSDKDMKQIPGWLFNPDKHTQPELIAAVSADEWFYTQVLTGDATDGYKGCPGIGAKRAERIIEGSDEDYWRTIVDTYNSKGLTHEHALQQARVARICRWTDYDFERKQVKLWTP